MKTTMKRDERTTRRPVGGVRTSYTLQALKLVVAGLAVLGVAGALVLLALGPGGGSLAGAMAVYLLAFLGLGLLVAVVLDLYYTRLNTTGEEGEWS
jgi:hypothetical protein